MNRETMDSLVGEASAHYEACRSLDKIPSDWEQNWSVGRVRTKASRIVASSCPTFFSSDVWYRLREVFRPKGSKDQTANVRISPYSSQQCIAFDGYNILFVSSDIYFSLWSSSSSESAVFVMMKSVGAWKLLNRYPVLVTFHWSINQDTSKRAGTLYHLWRWINLPVPFR
jgi:hypothetical protein